MAVCGSALPESAYAQRSAEELEKRSREIRQRIEALAEDETEILASMQAMNELVQIEEAALEAARAKVEDTRAAIAFIEADRSATSAMLSKKYAELEPRLVARYKMGRPGYFQLMFSAGSVSEFLALRRLMGWVIDADIESVREVRRLSLLMEEQYQSLEKANEEMAELQEFASLRLESLREAGLERENTLARIREDRSLQQQRLMEVQRARREMQQRMQSVAQGALAERGFESLKGRLPWPVEGKITKSFGGVQDGTGSQQIHRGIDISAPAGTPVRAVAPGRVVHADWLRGYGLLAIIDHGGGFYSLMANLGRLAVSAGDEISTGSVVGLVGDTGLAEGALLYFEIRRGTQALNPEEWLKK